MKDIFTLDCTLRDGGYCNAWRFKEKNIKKIISWVSAANVEIVECGFLSNRVEYDKDVTKFTEITQVDQFIPEHCLHTKYVLMMNYGEYNVEDLPPSDSTHIDGIRLAFHKANRHEAIKACKQIGEKGYLVFVQPMVSMNYSDEEFGELINRTNEIQPYAFYIVDSFGAMDKKSLNHYFRIVEKELSEDILIGFHSHNNLQAAFMNAQSFLENDSHRSCIIDGSIYGMGRGAGNLNLELWLNELNKNFEKKYVINPILQAMDEVVNRFYEEKPWGYSLPNYLSAVHMTHPNYAEYLSEKKTLAIEDMDNIFSMMDIEKACEFDEQYIDELYVKYMSSGMTKNGHLFEIKNHIKDRKILFIAPGRNTLLEKTKILDFIKRNNPVVFSINCECPITVSDYIFISNIRRFKQLDEIHYQKTISTSNIKSSATYVSIDYFKLLNDVEGVKDNAGLMALKFAMTDLNAKEINIAGLDGYSHELLKNFETEDMALIASVDFLDKINSGMRRIIGEYRKDVLINSITTSLLM